MAASVKMKVIDRQFFGGFVRMSPNRHDHLLELIKPIIMKKNAVRAPIQTDECLAIALTFLQKQPPEVFFKNRCS